MQQIKLAIERSRKALTLRPALGRKTSTSRARMIEGLTCEVEEGEWKFLVDMPEGIGGNEQGPKPGVMGRAAFGSCLVICYMMKAATMNIPIHSLEIEVQTDYDDGGLLGVGDAVPGYSETRYFVTIESDAPKETIMQMLDDADRHSPWLTIFSSPQQCKRGVHIITPKLQS